jgi:thioredoxin-related protein
MGPSKTVLDEYQRLLVQHARDDHATIERIIKGFHNAGVEFSREAIMLFKQRGCDYCNAF